MPGFIDCHAHIMANGSQKENISNPLALHFYNAIKHGKQAVDAGVTTAIRDCGPADIGVKIAQKKVYL